MSIIITMIVLALITGALIYGFRYFFRSLEKGFDEKPADEWYSRKVKDDWKYGED